MTPPAVSVIMPVYNAAAFLGRAIDSVVTQTFTDWELIVVDDGSTDGFTKVVERYASDPRIHSYTDPINQGVSHALNRALGHARGTFIARLDADDIALPQRLEEQVNYFIEHPDVGLLGGRAITISEKGDAIGAINNVPLDNTSIQYTLLFNSAFVSSTVMFRRALLEKTNGFCEDGRVFDDFDMWSRIARNTRAANLPDHLVQYRIRKGGLTGTTPDALAKVREQRRRNFNFYLPHMEARTLELLASVDQVPLNATIPEMIRARNALYHVIGQLTTDPRPRRRLRADARRKLKNCQLVDRDQPFGVTLDRILKTIVLRFNGNDNRS